MQLHSKLLFGMALVVWWTVGCSAGAPSPSETRVPSSGSMAPTAVGSSLLANTPPQGTLGGGSKKIGPYTVALFSTPNPPVRGSNTLEALVVNTNNLPVTDATVSFDIDMTNMSHGKNVVAAKLSGNGRYAGTLFFMMPGPWRVIVVVERAGEPAVSDRFNFSVNLR